jgi:hypothetical protein
VLAIVFLLLVGLGWSGNGEVLFLLDLADGKIVLSGCWRDDVILLFNRKLLVDGVGDVLV